jgi:osmotically-inducible protein OsmY
MGIKGVTNRIHLTPHVAVADVKAQIESAFARQTHLDAEPISIDASGDTVTLRGVVKTWTAKDEAEQAVWFAPGVSRVHNDIIVSPS